jgi:hypothetical protein
VGAREARINHPRLHHTPSLPAPREQATDRHLVVLDRLVRRTLAGLPVQQARPCTCGSHYAMARYYSSGFVNIFIGIVIRPVRCDLLVG